MKKYKPPKPDELLPIEVILDAGLAEFAEKGLSGARIESIASRAKISPSLLYYYFDNKDELYLSVLEYGFRIVFEQLGDKLKLETDFMNSFGSGFMSTYEILKANPNITRLLLRECVDGAVYLKKLREKHPEWVGSNVRVMVDKLKVAINAGLVRNVDPERTIALATASIFLILGAGPVLQLMNISEDFNDDPYLWFSVVIDIFANALRPS